MGYEAVDVYIKNDAPSPVPIEGVLVKVFSQDGKLVYTQATTNADGHVGFLLPADSTYQLRFYKAHVSFQNPRYITVLGLPSENVFDVAGSVFTPPTPLDARLCTAFGYFRSVTGAPQPYVDLHFVSKFRPLLLEGDAVMTERVSARSDREGYVQIDLIRCGKYDVTVQGLEDYRRCITVPDAPNANLPDLLFPVVRAISFSPSGPFSVAAGADLSVTPTVTASDGRVLEGAALEDVQFQSSDRGILEVIPQTNTLVLRGIAAGSAQVTAVRRDSSIVVYPDPGITGVPVSVTVT